MRKKKPELMMMDKRMISFGPFPGVVIGTAKEVVPRVNRGKPMGEAAADTAKNTKVTADDISRARAKKLLDKGK